MKKPSEIEMPMKPNPGGPVDARAANLFYQARLLELMSVAHRVCGNASETIASRPATTPTRALSQNNAPVFHLTIDPCGWWAMREHNGSKAGLFRTRQAAIKYAREESPNGQFVIIDDVR